MNKGNSQNNGFRFDIILVILIIPGLIAALMVGAGRHKIESGNRSIEMVLDYVELQNLSVSSNTPMPDLLTKLKDAGVTGVAISEDIMGDLANTGRATYSEYAGSDKTAYPTTEVAIPDPRLASRVVKALEARLPKGYIVDLTSAKSVPHFWVQAMPNTLDTIGLGLSPDAVKMVQASGLDVVGRIQNYPSLTTKGVDASLKELKDAGITRLICSADEVLGYRGLIKYTADKITEDGLVFGSIEFSKQRGDARMGKELDSRFIRVHSISVAEMGTMAPSSIVERFARAVKERDIKLCYVRLPEVIGEDPLQNSLDFISSIRKEMEKSSYQMGVAKPFDNNPRPKLLLILMTLSIAAGGVLLLTTLFSVSPTVKYGILVVGFIIAAGLSMVETGRQLLALKAALIFPTLGVTALVGNLFSRETDVPSPLRKACGMFIGMSLFSGCGALLVVGLLSDRMYMVKVEQFMGIKAAHLLPLLYVMFFMAAGLPIFGKPFKEVWADMVANIRKLMAHPLFVWHAIAVMVALVIIGFAVMRTGNDSAVGISGFELKFRAILDKIMMVRPRTKEFMLGHPAMLVGLALMLSKRKAWGLPLVAFGVLGQVSLLNTFCHIHSPLAVSILRAFNGVVVGLLVGIVAWLIFARPKGKPSEQA